MPLPSRRTLLVAGAVAAVLLVIAWMARPRTTEVEALAVGRGPMLVTVDEEGRAIVRERFVVSAPFTGRMERLALEPGDPVSRGDVLGRMVPAALDPRGAAEAAAAVGAAEAALREAEAAVPTTRAAAAQARREAERARALAAAGAVAPRGVEEAELAAADAAAAAEAAVARVGRLQAEVRRARAVLAAPAAGAATTLRAPAGGRVLRRLEESQRVVPAGTPLVEIGDPDDLEIVVDLRSEDAVLVRPGARMLLDGGAVEEQPSATVHRVEPAAFTKVSALGVEEQRVNVIGRFGGAAPSLGDGYRVDVRIVVWESPDVLRVPAGAVFRDADGWAAFVVEDGRARRRSLTLGHQSGEWAEVLAGLSAGERVVMHPSDRIADGVRVRGE